MKANCLFLLTLLLTASSCKKKDPNALPDTTQEGRNSAGFLFDGQPWIPEWQSSTSTNSPVDASWQRTSAGRSLSFGFSRLNDKEYKNVDFFIPDIRRAGTFLLNQTASPTLGFRNPAYGRYTIDRPTPLRLFLTGPTATGTVTVTRFDTVARVVSGTFDLTVQEETSPETHRLTDGRFDLTF